MILRTIIYIPIVLFFLWEYRQNKKSFKLLIFPIIALSLLGGTKYYTQLDNRFQLTVLIITILLTGRVLWGYYNEFKIERFRNKKYLRELREKNRVEKSEELMEQILEAKNTAIRNNSSSYEISMEMTKDYEDSPGSTQDFIDIKEEFEEDLEKDLGKDSKKDDI